MVQTILIIGGGIVGAALACEIARRPDARAVVLEQADAVVRGSTAFAPGFIGMFNDSPLLTDLAMRSAEVYDSFTPSFRRAGGVELARSAPAQAELARRVATARDHGLDAELIGPGRLSASVREFVDEQAIESAAFFAQDGVADAPELLTRIREHAHRLGAKIVPGERVVAVAEVGDGVAVRTAAGREFESDAVVLAAGIWGRGLAELVGLRLPLHPVAHPYVYSGPSSHLQAGPFVRWPEHHVYARVHHNQLGIGSYDHYPVPVEEHDLELSASLPWRNEFTPVIDHAQRLLTSEHRFTPVRRINGVFAMTPDNLPFIGPVPDRPRVWIAQALWITHAAGAARLLAPAILDHAELPTAYSPARFNTIDADTLRAAAHKLYRDIYANDAA